MNFDELVKKLNELTLNNVGKKVFNNIYLTAKIDKENLIIHVDIDADTSINQLKCATQYFFEELPHTDEWLTLTRLPDFDFQRT